MGRRKFNLTERNIHYALDYNCNTSRALASGLYRPLWRRSDSSSARDCRRCARYSAHSRQTALSESVFAPVVSIRPCVLAMGLHTLNAIMHSLRSEFRMKNRHGICGYQFVTCFPVEFPKRRPEIDPLPICRIQCLNRISDQ